MYENEKARLKKQTAFTMDDLNLIIKILRAKDGCPWDIEQTHQSIRKGLIEETYEVVEAIDNNDMTLMREAVAKILSFLKRDSKSYLSVKFV